MKNIGQMFVGGDAPRKRRGPFFSRRDSPPPAGITAQNRSFREPYFARALNRLQVAVEHPIPNQERSLPATDRSDFCARNFRPICSIPFAIVRAVVLEFVHAAIVRIAKHRNAVHPAGALYLFQVYDHPLTGGHLRAYILLPALRSPRRLAGGS